MRNKNLSFMMLVALSLAALLSGCGSSSKEGRTGGSNVALVSEGTCSACHSATIDRTSGTGIITDYVASMHNPVNSSHATGCQGCHGGGAQHNGVGPFEWPNPLTADRCIQCHIPAFSNGQDLTALFAVAKNEGFVQKCAPCHTKSGVGSVHAAAAPDTESCIACHDVSAPAHSAASNDGVRAITGEFAKRSHHVTGRALNNTDCAVCHLEGEGSTGTVLIDRAMHMNAGIINLRNGNISLLDNQTKSTAADGTAWTRGTGTNPLPGKVQYAWNPATPDHALMDQFCFSCHNADGAPTAVAALELVPNATGFTRTALNPFGDSVSNDYDQVSRLNVVDAYNQFATANSSHHAVRGQKYALNALTPAMFSNISTANINFIDGNVATPIRGTRATSPQTQVVNTSLSGTMFQTGKFVATYTVLGTTTPVADNSTLHCGDCHTVGQFKSGSAVKVDGTPTTVVIGAHGSNNEYMLRNSNSDDTFSRDALVCYICHKENVYSNPGQTELFTESGIVAHNSVNNSFADCNGNNENSAGLIGRARLVPEERAMDDATFQAEVNAGTYQPTGGGNIFGIKCANCHNASEGKTFGGIHGNAFNASYTTYSGAKNAAPAVPQTGASVAVSRKPYRFLPGLGNFRYNGGDSADQWMVKNLSQANRQGCYTLNGASTVTRRVDANGNIIAGAPTSLTNPQADASRRPNPSPTRADQSGPNVSALAIAGDNGLLGSWGACTDHGGTSVFGGRATTRTLLRPLTY